MCWASQGPLSAEALAPACVSFARKALEHLQRAQDASVRTTGKKNQSIAERTAQVEVTHSVALASSLLSFPGSVAPPPLQALIAEVEAQESPDQPEATADVGSEVDGR